MANRDTIECLSETLNIHLNTSLSVPNTQEPYSRLSVVYHDPVERSCEFEHVSVVLIQLLSPLIEVRSLRDARRKILVANQSLIKSLLKQTTESQVIPTCHGLIGQRNSTGRNAPLASQRVIPDDTTSSIQLLVIHG